MFRPLLLLAFLQAFAFLGSTHHVHAQVNEARQIFREGVRAAESGDWRTAAARFERAHELSDRPIILLNLAAAHTELGDPRAAHAALERFTREASDDVRRPQQSNVTAMRRELYAAAVRVRISADEGSVFVDDEPASGDVELLNPRTEYRLQLRSPDGDVVAEERVDGLAGEVITVRLRADGGVPTPREVAESAVGDDSSLAEEDDSSSNGVAIGLGITAAVLVVAAAITLGVLLSSPDAPNGFEGNLGRVEVR